MAPDKAKLDTLPNEIIQKIWPLSENPLLLFASPKIYSSLNGEHVKNTFHRTRAENFLHECLLPIPYPYSTPTRNRRKKPLPDIPIKSLFKILKLSAITNAELWDLGHDGLDRTRAEDFDSNAYDAHGVRYYGYRYDRLMMMRLPVGLRLPENLAYGSVHIKVIRVDKKAIGSPPLPPSGIPSDFPFGSSDIWCDIAEESDPNIGTPGRESSMAENGDDPFIDSFSSLRLDRSADEQ